MDTGYRNGSGGDGNADSGAATRRMDMADMQDEGSEPLGESSSDAVSAAEAGTSATVNQGSGAEDYSNASNLPPSGGQTPPAVEEMQMSDAIGDDMIGQDGDADDVAGSTGDSAGSNAAPGSRSTHRSSVPDYILETVAEGLRERGHSLSADDLDAVLGDAGFTINPDPWRSYQPRPSLAEGAIQQRQAQDAGGFVSAAPASSVGSVTLPPAEQQEAAAPDMGEALSQIQADEAQTVSPTGSAAEIPAVHPEPVSGLEVQSTPPVSMVDTAAGAASGMADSAATEPPAPAPSPSYGAPAEGIAVSDVGPLPPSPFAAYEPAPSGGSAAAEPGLTYGQALPMEGESQQAINEGQVAPLYPQQESQPMGGAAEGQIMPSPAQLMGDMGGTLPPIGEISGAEGASTVAMPPQPVASPVQAGSTAGPQLAPYIALSNGVEFPIGDKNEILIGREDPISDIFPDIDLTNFGGEEGGVSRRHARVIRDGDTYLLEDLNSTNYTKLNGVKLIPKIPQAIRDGDHLSFGKVEATFHLYK